MAQQQRPFVFLDLLPSPHHEFRLPDLCRAKYQTLDQVERGAVGRNREPDHAAHIERRTTLGGHDNDQSQPGLPTVHRTFANPAPLGLLSSSTGFFLFSLYGVNVRGITTPNLLIGVLMCFGGLCQFISGAMEFYAGNTFGATVFPSYGAFNWSYALIFLPSTGILASYTDTSTGKLNDQFYQALAMYMLAWFLLSLIYTVAAVRSSWVLFFDLVFLDLELLLLTCGYLVRNAALVKAGNGFGFVVAFLSCWAGCAGLWAGGITPINLPTFPMYQAR